MNFESEYCEELSKIVPSTTLNEKVLNANLNEKKRKNKYIYRRLVYGVIAAAFILMVSLNFNSIVTSAKSLWGQFVLVISGEKIEFGDIQPVEFDMEGFKNAEGTKVVTNSDASYYHDYHSPQVCKEATGLDLINADEIEYSYISVEATDGSSSINISASFKYKDFSFVLNGMTTAKGGEGHTWGYGTDDKAMDVYEYADGRKAYFVNEDHKVVCVYFQEGSIMYQMLIDTRDEEWGIDIGKELIDILLK